MPRSVFFSAITLQLDNPVQPPQWGAPALITSIAVVTDDAGRAVYQPVYHQQPAMPEDITEDLLAAIQEKMGTLGLEVTRKP